MQNINLGRNYSVAKKHLEIDDRFVSAILSNKSSRVDQLIRVYTGQGASRATITTASGNRGGPGMTGWSL
jgi:hypothetical protein